MITKFKIFGYAVDVLVGGKYIGHYLLNAPDRTEVGYNGRMRFKTEEDMLLTKGKVVKAGTDVVTELFPLCGAVIKQNNG